MSRLKYNIIANFLGRGWTAIMGLAFVPLYIKFMGIEAYGLVGFSATIQALSSLLDIGLSTTLNRELAILSAQEGKKQESRDLVRTLEIIFREISIQIKAQATFHDRFEQELTELKKIVQSNAKAIESKYLCKINYILASPETFGKSRFFMGQMYKYFCVST